MKTKTHVTLWIIFIVLALAGLIYLRVKFGIPSFDWWGDGLREAGVR